MGDPFSKSRGRAPVVAILLLVVVAGTAASALLLGDRDGEAELSPGPVVASLHAADLLLPADPASGYRPLSTLLPPGHSAYAIDVAPDGAVAVAYRHEARRGGLVLFRGGVARSFDVGQDGVTALAFDPEGDLHIGTRGGAVRRIGADGRLVVDPVEVAPGNSVVGFAFDAGSPKSAVMTAGGATWTALRPFAAATLHPVEMPRARVRAVAFEEGHLVVAGDAGAFFASTDDGWEERSLPTNGRVVALGHDARGGLLAAQANGHVFRADGVRWERLGQVPRAPIALGQLTGDRGVTVLAADGSVFALLGRDDFSALPEYPSPDGETVPQGVVAGANVAWIADGRAFVWDGTGSWDSRDPAVTAPAGTQPTERCEPIGPIVRDVPGLPEPLLRCGDAVFTVGPDGLAPATEVGLGSRRVPVADYRRLLDRVALRPTAFVGGHLWTVAQASALPGIERWDPVAGDFAPVAPTSPDDGPLLGLAVLPVGEEWEVWTISRAGTVSHGRARTGEDRLELAPVVTHDAFQALHADEEAWEAREVHLYPLGEGKLLVAHDRRSFARVHLGQATAEAVELSPVRRGYDRCDVFAVGPDVWVQRGDSASFRIGREGPATEPGWPEGLSNYVQSAVVRGDTSWVVVASRLVRCRAGTCAEVEVPGMDGLQDLLPAGDGHFASIRNGVVGVFPVPEG